ncbi:MAG: YqzE family protein [Brevibacillus sp.]|nr:YqzE family protein [Brevibacillus sp.]
MSFQEYLRFMVKRFLEYLETPGEERRRLKAAREAWSARWFGVIPMSIKMLWRK